MFYAVPEIQPKNETLVQPAQFQFQQDCFHTSCLANNKLNLRGRQPAPHIVWYQCPELQPSKQVLHCDIVLWVAGRTLCRMLPLITTN